MKKRRKPKVKVKVLLELFLQVSKVRRRKRRKWNKLISLWIDDNLTIRAVCVLLLSQPTCNNVSSREPSALHAISLKGKVWPRPNR